MQRHDLILRDGSRMMRGPVGDIMTSETSLYRKIQRCIAATISASVRPGSPCDLDYPPYKIQYAEH